jgi:hypothetical protein
LSKHMKANVERAMAPLNFRLQWQKWHEILSAYFPAPPNPLQSFGQSYYVSLNSIGWAGLISAYLSLWRVGWIVWAASLLTIIVSHITYILGFKQQYYPDPSGSQLAAQILRAIKTPPIEPDSSSERGCNDSRDN